MKAKKQRFKPYGKEEAASLEHTIAQMEVKKNELLQQELQLELGMEKLDEEIDASVKRAKAEVLAAEMQLKAAKIQMKIRELDKEKKHTEKRLSTNLQETRNEIKRHQQNIEALTKQLKEGIPILEEEKNRKGDTMSEEPEVEKTEEEKAKEETPKAEEPKEEVPAEPESEPEKEAESEAPAEGTTDGQAAE